MRVVEREKREIIIIIIIIYLPLSLSKNLQKNDFFEAIFS